MKFATPQPKSGVLDLHFFKNHLDSLSNVQISVFDPQYFQAGIGFEKQSPRVILSRWLEQLLEKPQSEVQQRGQGRTLSWV